MFKKTAAAFFTFVLLFCQFSTGTCLADNGVPKKVLDLRKSVVRVICQANDGDYSGSGFAIGKDTPIQYVVTNMHVVEPNINGVSILRENNREIKAKVYLQLPNADLCLLLLDEPLYDVPPVVLKDDKPINVGQAVYALGFPGAADMLSDTATGNPEDVTITDGIVSAEKSLTLTENGSPIKLLQINAAISHGNSGGPLVDGEGCVLAINTYGTADAENINGAVGINELIAALNGRSIAYLSSGEKTRSGYPYLTIIISGSIIIVVFIALFVLISLRRRSKKVKDKAVTLPEYLKQWGGKLPYDTAIRVLEPALQELIALHTNGRTHGDICPEKITISPGTNRARLLAPESAGGNRLVLRPNFSSPEQFRADGKVGFWSDVYSFCAVVYFMVTGNKPLGVMEQHTQGESGNIGFGEANISQGQSCVILTGLNIDAALRPQNAAELASALGLSRSAERISSDDTVVPITDAVAEKMKPAKNKMHKGRRLLIAGVSVLVGLSILAGGYYLFLETKYNEAIGCIAKQDYDGGLNALAYELRIYKSTQEYAKYAFACKLLQQNNFDNARELFKSLGDFNNAKEMSKKTDYLQAYYFLANSEFDKARSLFSALGNYEDSSRMILETDYQIAMSNLAKKDFDKAKGQFKALNDYSDSPQMVLESDYQKATQYMETQKYDAAIPILTSLSKSNFKDSDELLREAKYDWAIALLNQGKNKDAIEAFSAITGYKDSANYLDQTVRKIFNNAVSLYRNAQYSKAKDGFATVSRYVNCDDYLQLIDAHNVREFDVNSIKDLYQKLTALGTFEDAQQIRTNDLFIYYRLEGNWRGGSYYFKMNYTGDGWYTYYNIPWYSGKYFKIEDGIMYFGSDDKGWKKQFYFGFISENNMEVYCYKNGRTYTLAR